LDVVPVYVYFDLKKTATQMADNVVASLLTQIAWLPEKIAIASKSFTRVSTSAPVVLAEMI
jgi:hypothetical protein